MAAVENNLLARMQRRLDHEYRENIRVQLSYYNFTKLLQCNKQTLLESEEENEQNNLLQIDETDPPEDSTTVYVSSSEEEEDEEFGSDRSTFTFPPNSEISSGNELPVASVGVIPAVQPDSNTDGFTDHEDSDTGYAESIGFRMISWNTCPKCRQDNLTPQVKYCRNCFRARKELYPPRPRPFKKRSKLEEKSRRKRKPEISSEDSGASASDPKRRKILNSCAKEVENCNNVPDSEVSGKSCTSELRKQECDTLKNKTEEETKLKKTEMVQKNYEFTKDLCIMCATMEIDTVFVHGTTAHLTCCYYCAVKTWKITKCCPVCKKKVEKIYKVYS